MERVIANSGRSREARRRKYALSASCVAWSSPCSTRSITSAAGVSASSDASSAVSASDGEVEGGAPSSASHAIARSTRAFNAGSFIIKAEGGDLDARLKQEVTALGLTANAVDKLPEVAQHALAVPRIALVHTWTNTHNEGWYRVEFDRLGIPYDYISDQVIGKMPNLRDKWDVIVWGPVGGTAQSLVRGIPNRGEKDSPIPWQKSDLTPNMGQSPDTTADMRGGMGIVGVANLQKFIEGGGLFITVGSNASIPIDFGITEGVSIQEARTLNARGSIMMSSFADRKSPIAYGYDEKLSVYFNQAPLLQVAAGGPGGFGAYKNKIETQT